MIDIVETLGSGLYGTSFSIHPHYSTMRLLKEPMHCLLFGHRIIHFMIHDLWTLLYLYTFCPLSPISWLRILERCGRWWWPVVRASGQQADISAVTSRIVGWQLSVIVTGRKCGKASRLSALSTYQPSTSCSLSHATPATSVPGLTWNANSQFKCPK